MKVLEWKRTGRLLSGEKAGGEPGAAWKRLSDAPVAGAEHASRPHRPSTLFTRLHLCLQGIFMFMLCIVCLGWAATIQIFIMLSRLSE